MKNKLSGMIMTAALAAMMIVLPAFCQTQAAKAEAVSQTAETVQTQIQTESEESALMLQLSFESGEAGGELSPNGEQDPNAGAAQGEAPGEPPQGQPGEPPQGFPGDPESGEGLQMQLQGDEDGEFRGGRKGEKHGQMPGETAGQNGENGMNREECSACAQKQGLGPWAIAAIAGGAGLIVGAGVMAIIMGAKLKKAKKAQSENANEQKRENEKTGGEEDAYEVKQEATEE